MTTPTKRVKDVEEVIGGLARQVRAVEKRAGEEDPWAVAEMLRMRDELDAAVVRTVARLRDRGYTWKDIGFNMGIGPVTAHKRYAAKIDALPRQPEPMWPAEYQQPVPVA